ncbi:MAG: hypothetical protein FWJ70_14170 [Micromonosporaceae bacterium]|jgi:hypothetical protein
MSDDLGPRLARLRDVEPPFPFAAPEAVRRRGEQRARRQAAVAAVAVVAATGLAVGVGSAVLAPAPTTPPAAPSATAAPGPGPSRTVSPDTVPPGWLLTLDDLGPGSWHSLGLLRPRSDGPEWESELPPAWPPPECLGTTRPPERVALASASWTTHTGADDAGLLVDQVVERYRPGEAAAAVAVFREGVERCAGGDVVPGVGYAVVDDGFTGDESLLVLETQTPADESDEVLRYVGVVRVGDAVVTLQSNYPDLQGADSTYLRRLAEVATERIAGSG